METEQIHREYFNDPQLYSLAMNTRDEVVWVRELYRRAV